MKGTSLKINIKQASKQQDEEENQNEVNFCFFCHKKAEFKCGLCLEATYCTPEHQKADWPTHKRKCIRPEDKLKDLQRQLQNHKKLFFDKLSKGLKIDCEGICNSILEISQEIVQKFPSPMHQIQYGSAICCYVKMLLSVKSFNVAQEILSNYVNQRYNFLRNTDDIPQKLKVQDHNFSNIIKFVEGKLKLLSVLCNLTHQIVRDSVYMVRILIDHCEKFYGKDTLQASNVYFQLGNYYFFMNMWMKSCACFLIAGKIRQSKGIACFYNVAIILMRNHSFHKAIKFLNKCLQMIFTDGDTYKIIDRIYLAMAFCYKKMNHFDNTVHFLEKALCQINIKKRFNINEQKNIRQLLKILSQQYKKEFNNDEILSLPKQKVTADPQIVISNNNLEDFMDLDADNTKKKRAEQWIKSFKNQAQKTKYESKVPMTNPLIQRILFHNHFTDDKNDQNLSGPASKAISSQPSQYINVDLEFMSKLTSTQVKFMNQLNRLLVINKDKPTLNDIIQNSNLMQQMSKEKIQRFYQLNPQLLRQKQDYNLMDEQEQKSVVRVKPPKNEPIETNKQPNQKQNLKLDLNKLPKKQ